MIMYTNIPKLKKMPNTKRQLRYLVPYMVERISGENAGQKRVPIHIVRPYFERDIGNKLENKLKKP